MLHYPQDWTVRIPGWAWGPSWKGLRSYRDKGRTASRVCGHVWRIYRGHKRMDRKQHRREQLALVLVAIGSLGMAVVSLASLAFALVAMAD